MRLIEREIKMLVLPDGRCPFSEWFGGLQDDIAAANVAARLTRLEAGSLGDCDAVGDGVCELRIHYGPGYRVYFGQTERTIVVLLCGGTKATQRRDMARARDVWSTYRDEPTRFQ
jgi:putative addiction module killer protein